MGIVFNVNQKNLKAGIQAFVLITILMAGVFSANLEALASGQPQEAAAPLLGPAYPNSTAITGISFDWSTHQRSALGSDNWPVTWADDGNQYTSWGDGGGFGGANYTGRVSLGFARIEGDASSYRGVNIWGGVNSEASAQFTGKSYGMLAIGSKLYAWRCGDGSMATAYLFQQLYESTDRGHTWNFTGVEYNQGYFGSTRGFFCPTFLQFGQGYTGARDGYVYMYAPELKVDVWAVQKPGEITLIRVPIAGLKDRSQYQFYTGKDASGNPTWTSTAANRKPVFTDGTNGVMLTSAIYNAGLKRYLLVVAHTVAAGGGIGIYDSPNPWGPWTTVLFTSGWGSPNIEGNTFFWNFSNKWTSADGKDFTLVFTGSSTNDSWNTVRGRFTTSGTTPPPTTPPTQPPATPTTPPTQPPATPTNPPTQPPATPTTPPTQPPPTATNPPPTQPPPTPVPSGVTVLVNFQPGGKAAPSGYLADSGLPFGNRGNGYTYGWSADNQANTRDRDSSLSSDDRFDTLNHMQKDGQAYTWEIALPNGSYQVRITAGDASHWDSVYNIVAEGVTVVNGTPASDHRWVTGSAIVTVNDGRLTVTNGAGASNNKIDFIEIGPPAPAGNVTYRYFIYLPGVNR